MKVKKQLHEVHLTDSSGICDIIEGINEIIRFINYEIIPPLNNNKELCSNNICDYCVEGGFCGKKPSLKCFEGINIILDKGKSK
jgi:hypothetical protein